MFSWFFGVGKQISFSCDSLRVFSVFFLVVVCTTCQLPIGKGATNILWAFWIRPGGIIIIGVIQVIFHNFLEANY